jgi:hypothetical protein
MDSSPKMDVTEWQNSPRPILVEAGIRRPFLPPALIGILGTLLLHAMLIQSISFASRGSKPKPPEAQESASALSKSTADADNLVLISLPTIANATQSGIESAISSLPDLNKMKVKSPISADPPEFLNLETLALSEDQGSVPGAGGADGAEQARLFGIYTGQIQARIDRVWRRPRAPVNGNADQKATADESFQCEAQIIQDARGNVQEILLPRCNGSEAWQHSLVLAIQQASPLPAPPSAKVFTQSISLQFVGLPYLPGSAPDEYEFEPRDLIKFN